MWPALLLSLLWLVGLPEPVRGAAEQGPAPPVRWHFTGHQAWPTSRLQAAAADELRLFSHRGQRTAIDDAAYRMQQAYRRAGYHFARVDYEIDQTAEISEVHFRITEGPQVLLGAITFRGNTVFSDQELDALVQNLMRGENAVPGAGPVPFVEHRLNGAIDRIRELYRNQGYREIAIEPGEVLFIPAGTARDAPLNGPWRATMAIRLSEGVRWLITDLELDHPPPPPAAPAVERALARAADELVGQPYFTRRQLVLRSHLLEAFRESGYPEAQIHLADRPGPRPGEIILQAATVSGPLVIVAEIEIQGNRRTATRFINRRLHFVPGATYDDRHRRASFQELYGSGRFSRINFELQPLAGQFTVDTDHAPVAHRRLVVTVEETASRELFLAGGWGSYEMLRLRAGFTDHNLFGHGRILRLETGGSLKGAEVKAGITDPWLFETPTQAEVPLFYRIREEPSFTRTEVGLGLLFGRDLPHALTASLAYQIRHSEISKVTADADREDAAATQDGGYGIASLKFQLSRDTRNDIFFPTAGHRAYGAVEIADKSLGGDLGFYRFTGGWRQFREISPNLTLGWRLDTGLVLPGRHQLAIPLGERFYNGGENSVRSFREGRLGPKDLGGQPVGGMAHNTLSLELRRRLGKNLALSLFADYGNLSPNRSRAEAGKTALDRRSEVISATLSDYFSDFRPALGAGVQYLLPVGPARLDLAFNPDRRPDRHEPDFVVHFSLGMAF